jgi:hypothetical protein
MGVALGLSFCLAVALIDPSGIASLIAHNAAPRTTAVILISFFTLIFGAGTTLTGMMLTGIESAENQSNSYRGRCYTNATQTDKVPLFRVRSSELMTAIRAPGLGFARGSHRASPVARRADMPAFTHHHEIEMPPVICPGCVGFQPMYVRDVEPHWSMAKIDFVFECSDCGAEVRHTVRKPVH